MFGTRLVKKRMHDSPDAAGMAGCVFQAGKMTNLFSPHSLSFVLLLLQFYKVYTTMRPNQVAARATFTLIWCAGVFALPNGDNTTSNPKPRAECNPYMILWGDNCSKISSKLCHSMKLDDLYRYNAEVRETSKSRKVSRNSRSTSCSLMGVPYPYIPVHEIIVEFSGF